jgi:putative hemolysin
MKETAIRTRTLNLVAPLTNSLRRKLKPSQFIPGVRNSMNRLLPFKTRQPVPVAPAEDVALLAAEIAALPPRQILLENGEFVVFQAQAAQAPGVLRELGRLREVAFRNVDEGTGYARDLDRFDDHYTHLCLWNQETQEIVGAYRLAQTEEIRRRFGTAGLYTHSLFDYDVKLLARLGPAIELGRAFVRVEYQRAIAPLFLLWKGIGHYVAANPQCRQLFGPVSISNAYAPLSRGLMIEFLRAHHFDMDLAAMVRARTPLKPNAAEVSRNAQDINSVEELSAKISSIESDNKSVPILLKQYLKLNGRLIGFNLDREFSDVADGLIVIDLTKTDRRILERYMGEDGARDFLNVHAEAPAAICA